MEVWCTQCIVSYVPMFAFKTEVIYYFVIFADDTNIVYADSDVGKFSNNMFNVLDKMSTWSAGNRLTLNIYNIHYNIFGKDVLIRYVVRHIRNVNIERVTVVMFLRVYVEDLLNWNYDIIYVKSKLSKSVGLMYRCSYLLNRSSMQIIYC